MPFEFEKEIGLLLRALKIHGDKIQSELLAVTLSSLLGAFCDVGKLTTLQFKTIGLWILEAAFSQELRKNPNTNPIQKIIVDNLDGSKPSVAYLRMPVWHVSQVEALHLQDKVAPLANIERMLPPDRPEDN
jgi:hypothetical protein